MKIKSPKKTTYSRTEARNNLPKLLDRVKEGEGPVYIAERGTTQAVLVSYEDFKKTTKPPKKLDVTKLNMYGMWKDRKDMEDSVKWVNKIREEEESRSYNQDYD